MATTIGRIIAVALVSACSSAQNVPPPGTTASAELVDDTRMLRHWVAATDLRDAVVKGNLTDALVAAVHLEKHGPAEPETVWLPHVAAVTEQIAAAKGAQSIAEASRATARLGAACGNCHRSLDVTVEMPRPSAPVEGASPRDHMRRHAWAIDALWAGLVVPSDGRWSDGVGVFAERPLHETDSNSELITSAVVKDIGTRIHDLAMRGADEPDPAARAEIFGDVIAACGDCHGQTRGGPAHATDVGEPKIETLGD